MKHSEITDKILKGFYKVGGIHANSTYPAEFIFSNMQVQMNIINGAENVTGS